jgi:hypothetical protein
MIYWYSFLPIQVSQPMPLFQYYHFENAKPALSQYLSPLLGLLCPLLGLRSPLLGLLFPLLGLLCPGV